MLFNLRSATPKLQISQPTLTTGPAPRCRTIRPFGAYALHGLASVGEGLITMDAVRGYLLLVNPQNDNTTVLNPYHVDDFLDATGLALWQDTLWFTRDEHVYTCPGIFGTAPVATQAYPVADLKARRFVSLVDKVDGIAICGSVVYVSCERQGFIFVFNRETGKLVTKFYAPGVGAESLAIRGEELWVCDRTEQTVYCMDRATGEVQFSLLTPFEKPSGLAFHLDSQANHETLYVAYANEEPYIRDDPNAIGNPYQLEFRDRTFIHPLHFSYNKSEHCTLSNGYLIEMSYVEELSPLDAFHLENVEWRIALPAETHRQRVRHVEPIGIPFTEEIQDGQRIAVFKFDDLKPHEGRLFGWKALLEVYSIKYNLAPLDVEKVPELSSEFEARYLVDDDELAMDTAVIQRAAQEAVGDENNFLRKVLSIRDFVYDRLSYGIKPRIDTPDVVWSRGIGSCGEYVGVLLALMRLNGIACRTVGRYKCPIHAADQHWVPLQPDFNHVWLEFYVPDFGWVPMESNPDDLTEYGPYPTRFFMGLAWYHAEVGRGIPFERVLVKGVPLQELPLDVSLGDLAINHVRFVIQGELLPPGDEQQVE